MNKRLYNNRRACSPSLALCWDKGMILDMVANKVIQKYQTASCEQLWQQKGQPKSPEEQKAVQFLRNDPGRPDCLHQPGGGSNRQQDVRMRHGSVSFLVAVIRTVRRQ